MSALWGFAAGQQQAQQDRQNRALFDLSMASGAESLKQQDVEIQTAELSLRQQQLMMKNMQGMDSTGNMDPGEAASAQASRLFSLADAAGRAGLVKESADLAAKASTIQRNQAYITEQQAKTSHQVMTDVSSLLGNVHDQASWEQAKQTFTMLHPQETANPLTKRIFSMPYSPDLLDSLRSAALTAKDQALMKAAEARARAADAQTKLTQHRVGQVDAETKLAESRMRDLKKHGGGNKLPRSSDIAAAAEVITKAYGEANDPVLVKGIARKIAEDMRDMEDTEGLTQTEAASRAVAKAEKAGELAGLRKMTALPGTTKENPIPWTPDLAKNPKLLRNNMIYSDQGQLAVWDAKAGKMKPLGSE